jgi:hypothetical protein
MSVNESLTGHSTSANRDIMELTGPGNTDFFNDRGNKQLSSDFVPETRTGGGFSDETLWP